MGRRLWRLGGATVVALAVGAAVAWLTVAPSPAPRDLAAAGPASPPPDQARPAGADEVPRPGGGEPPLGGASQPAPDGVPVPSIVDQALSEHAQEAAPRWHRAAELLEHSPHPELSELARGMAGRLHAAAESGLDAAHRQELVNEERQLLHFLRQRYDGYIPLERPLDRIDQSLQELEAVTTEPVASPDPRERRPAP